MREAKIILPVNDNAGNSADALHEDLEIKLCYAFGGATVTEGTGLWENMGKIQKEKVKIYTVAAKGSGDDSLMIGHIAWCILLASDQIAIYWQGFDGEAHITPRP